MQIGDEICAFDGQGRECRLRVTGVLPHEVRGERLAWLENEATAPQALALGHALPKGAKLDLIIEKCSELGLTTLVPLFTARTVVREMPERLAGKVARWQRIAEAAARQCGRRTLLDVQPPMALAAFCQTYAAFPVKLIGWEDERHTGVRHALQGLSAHSAVAMLIGPEGGWATQEVALARAHGFLPVSLGPYVLRTETAAIALTSIVRYSWGAFEPQGERG